MRITIFAAGSRGDVQPCVMLGRELQRAGFNVLLAAPENFAGFIKEHGLSYHPLRGDVQQIMASETGRGLMETGRRGRTSLATGSRTPIRNGDLQLN